ncbi:CHC2 zinc finger domain-containing protein [Amycolatopsis sp. NPDC051758]|uniref:CHC2 zinc finger domain-containing protein n=1 Tax=Amycolatopsis sp. NPDC051758 TaxID=3363935 RepID=UPI0037B2BDB5
MSVTAATGPEPRDIVAVVGQHVTLMPHTGDRLRGVCPFCGSAVPAFIVRPAHGTFHCLRCGQGGNATHFAAAIDR